MDRSMQRIKPLLALRSRGVASLRQLSALIMLYHALRLLHVGAHVLFRSEPLKLLAQLLVDHFYLEHLRIELHRSELDVEAVPWRNSATRAFCRGCLCEAHRGLGLALYANGRCRSLLLSADELGVKVGHVLWHLHLRLVV